MSYRSDMSAPAILNVIELARNSIHRAYLSYRQLWDRSMHTVFVRLSTDGCLWSEMLIVETMVETMRYRLLHPCELVRGLIRSYE